MNDKTIWNYAQNKPSLVVSDLKDYAPSELVYEVLLKRGVFKWLSARRKLIKLKNTWKDRINKSLDRQKTLYGADVNYERGYRKAYEECRAEVRSICHGERWEAPDFDTKAVRWLRDYNKN